MCGSGSGALKLDGGGTLLAQKIYVSGACVASGTISPNPDEGSVQIGDPLADLKPPIFGPPGAYCGDPAEIPTPDQTDETTSKGCDFKKNGATYNLKPGVYYGGWKITGSGVTVHLEPGIYIIAGGGISLGASGTITSVSGATGPAPVLIFNTDNPKFAAVCKTGGGSPTKCQDNVKFTASSDLLLHGMDTGPYKGILLWQDGDGSGATASNHQDVELSGQGSLTLTGTVYAPRGVVTLSGGSSGTGYASVQIISWNWKVTGGGTLLMPYDPTLLYQFPQKGLVR
jgi:hypothetical protein